MADTRIGRDIDLLCEVVTRLGARGSTTTRATHIQRVVRVGWVKALRLIDLAADRGLLGPPDNHRYPVLFGWDDVAAIVERLRAEHAQEQEENRG